MSADIQTAPYETLVLENGLRVRLYHEPRLKRAAAFLRVDAGSHDVAPAWPGLAHFLEHLFFLGTDRFSGDQALMAYVQRQGGQLNASTRERHTDYFFEVPPPAFSGALERLCEMLARPRMSPTDQRREREVLHAEFIAWSRDPEAQHQLWATGPLSGKHPLRAFHAGNRYSLPVARPDFQLELQTFYRRFYQAPQMTLCVVGPQSLMQLQAVVQRSAACLGRGTRQPRPVPPSLLDDTGDAQPQADGPRFNLLFACHDLPEGAEQAVAFLSSWCTNHQPGGLQAELRRRELIESMSVKLAYHYADQAVIDIEFKLTPAGEHAVALIRHLCFDWLEFFEALGDWQPLREEYALLQKRQRLSASALELARRVADEGEQDVGLSDAGGHALAALLAQLKPERVLHPTTHKLIINPNTPGIHWRLPQRNRFLRPSRRPDQAVADVRGMNYAAGSTSGHHEAEVFLRWRVNASHQTGLWRVLDNGLQRLNEEARQAGVKLSFASLGDDWQLRMSGVEEPMPALLEQVLEGFVAPPPEAWRQLERADAPAQMPIRELLKRLPEHCLGHYHASKRNAHEDVQPGKLQKLWGAARWDGLAVGLSSPARSALNHVLRKMPGLPDPQLAAAPKPLKERLWSHVALGSSEHALLLFCPAPLAPADEAAWRMLGHLMQTAFYQRMRVELQLGYGVFCSFRQIAGRAGLVFGVQSPGSSPAQILGHIETFFEQAPKLVGQMGSDALISQGQALAARLSVEEMESAQLGELLWQAQCGGHPSDYLAQLQGTLGQLKPTKVMEAVSDLAQARHGWLCLANGEAPDDRWRAVR